MTWISQLFSLLRPLAWWTVVAPWESGLRVRLGKVAKVLPPGFHWRIPLLDRVFVQSVRLRIISDSGQTMATADGRTLTMNVAVEFAITDIRKLYESVQNPESTLLLRVQAIVAKFVSGADSGTLTPERIEEYSVGRLPAEEWGLGGVRMTVVTFAYIRAFRLMMHEYRSSSGLYDTEQRA